MASLNDFLNTGSPVIWVKTDEVSPVFDNILHSSKVVSNRRTIYRLNPFSGLEYWCTKTSTWRMVIVPTPEGEYSTISSPAHAFRYVYNKGEVLVVLDAHLIIEEIATSMHFLEESFRNEWKMNSADDLPMQMIFASNQDCPSAEISAICAHTEIEIPSVDNLLDITNFVLTNSDIEVDDPASLSKNVAVAGHGYSESHFRNALIESYRSFNTLDPEWILQEKLKSIKQSCGLDIKKPKITFDDIGGLDNIKNTIDLVTWMWENPEESQKMGVSPIRRMLMVGIPGTGKSAICEATAKYLKLDLAKIGVSQALSKWIGESEQNVRAQFRILNALSPIVAWIDEFGRDFSGGGTSNDGGTTDRVHGEFLTGIQELSDNIFLMAAANDISGLAPELLRADRFDKIFFVGFPTFEERLSIFNIHLGDYAESHNITDLADNTEWWTGAEIKALIEETKFIAFGTTHEPPTTDQILKVAAKTKNRLWLKRRDYVLNSYSLAIDEYEWASKGQREDAYNLLSGKAQSGNKQVISLSS